MFGEVGAGRDSGMAGRKDMSEMRRVVNEDKRTRVTRKSRGVS
jgi:hypothetical protein